MNKKAEKRASKKMDMILCPIMFVFGIGSLVVGIISLVRGIFPTGGIVFVLTIWWLYDAIKTLRRLKANKYDTISPNQNIL